MKIPKLGEPENNWRFPIIRLKPIDGLSVRLKGFGSRKVFEAGEFLFRQTEEISNIYVVEDGLVDVAVLSKNGALKTIALCPPGVIIGEMGLLISYLNTAYSTALTRSTINVIELETMRKAFFEDPDISAGFYNSIVTKLQLTTNQLGIMTLNTPKARIAHILLDYKQSEIPLTQERLATMVGCSRVTVTRHLNQMQDLGGIQLKRKSIVILNSSSLEMFIK